MEINAFPGTQSVQGRLRRENKPADGAVENRITTPLRFGIDPIVTPVVVTAALTIGGAATTQGVLMYRKRKAMNARVTAFNKFLFESGSSYAVTRKNIYSISTMEALLRDSSGLTKVSELLPMLTEIEAMLPKDYQALIQKTYMEKGISHPSPEIRTHFIRKLTEKNATRLVFPHLVSQVAKETNTAILTALETAIMSMAAPEDLPEFQSGLMLAESGMRQVSISVLSKPEFFDSRVMGMFLEALKTEKNPDLLKKLRQGIARHASENFTQTFLEKLGSNHPEIQKTAIQFLAALKDETHFPVLLKTFQAEANQEVGQQLFGFFQDALTALVREKHLPLLLKTMNDGNEPAKTMSLILIKHLHLPAAVPVLLQFMETPGQAALYPAVREALVASMDQTQMFLMQEKLKSPVVPVRKLASECLAKISTPEDLPLLLTTLEQESDEGVRLSLRNAIKTLAIPPKEAASNSVTVETLSSALLSNTNTTVKLTAVQALKPHGIEAAHVLLKAMESTPSDTPLALVRELEEAIQGIFNETFMKNVETRRGWVTPDSSQYYSLLFLGLGSKSTRLQKLSLDILAVKKTGTAIEPLFQYLESPGRKYPKEASETLLNSLSKDQDVRLPLLQRLTSDKADVRLTAAKGLRNRAKGSDLDSLFKALEKEESADVRDALILAIKDLEQSPEAFDALSNALLTLNNPILRIIRTTAAQSLCNQGLKALSPLLIAFEKTPQGEDLVFKKELESALIELLKKAYSNYNNNGTDRRDNFSGIVQALSCTSAAVQKAALTLLEKSQTPASVRPLFEYLEKTPCLFKDMATTILLNSLNQESIPVLQERLSAPVTTSRLLALQGMQKMLKPAMMPALLEALGNESDPAIQKSLNDIIPAIDYAENIYPTLTNSLLTSPHPQVQMITAKTLRRYGLVALASLMPALEKLEATARKESGKEAGKETDISPSHLKAEVEGAIIEVLKKADSPRTSFSVEDRERISQCLSFKYEGIQAAALGLLTRMECTPVMGTLLTFLKSCPEKLMQPLTDLMDKYVNKTHHGMFSESMNSENVSVRRFSVRSLKRIGNPVAMDRLVAVLEKESDPEIREGLTELLISSSQNDKGLEFLTEALPKAESLATKLGIIRALKQNQGEALPPLFQAIDSLKNDSPKALIQALVGTTADIMVRRRERLASDDKTLSLALKGLATPFEALQDASFTALTYRSNSRIPALDSIIQYLEGPNCKLPDKAVTHLQHIVQNSKEGLYTQVNANQPPQEFLTTKLASPSPHVRMVAAQGLGRTGKEDDIQRLFDALEKETHPATFKAIREAIQARAKDKFAFQSISRILAASDHPVVQRAAAEILNSFGFNALSPLLDLYNRLNKTDVPEQTQGEGPQVAVPEASPDQTSLQGMIGNLILDRILQISTSSDSSTDELQVLFKALETPSEALQEKVLLLLKNPSKRKAPLVAPLFNYLDSARGLFPGKVEALLLEAIQQEHQGILNEKLGSPHPNVRMMAARGWAKLADPLELPNLLRVLEQEKDPAVVGELTEAVKACGKTSGSLQYLAMMLGEQNTPVVQTAIAQALENHEFSALPALLAKLDTSTDKTPFNLVRSLERTILKLSQNEKAAPLLMEKVDSQNPLTKRLLVLAFSPFFEKWEKHGHYDQDGVMGMLRTLSGSGNSMMSTPARRIAKLLVERKIQQMDNLGASATSTQVRDAIEKLSETAPEEEVRKAAKSAFVRILGR